MSRNCEIVLTDDKDRERARFRVPYGARLLVEEGQTVTRTQKLAEWDPYTLPIITERAGKIEYLDLIEGVTLVERMDEVTGLTSKVVVDYKQGAKAADLRPRLQLKDAKGEVARLANGTDARYFLSPDSILSVDNGARWRRATCWRVSRAKAARPATSPAVCRAWPNCSRRGGPRITRSSPSATGGWNSARTTRRSAGSS